MEKRAIEKYKSCVESIDDIASMIQGAKKVVYDGKIQQQRILEKNGFHPKQNSSR